MNKLTKNELKNRLEILKKILQNFDKEKFYNISFINIESFYSYLDIYNDTDYSMEEIMDSIDAYIPLKTFADYELIEILENGLCCENIDELKYFKTIFYKKAIIRFLYLISKANTKEQWKEILIACENMRKMG